jgi:UDP-N-acetylmuramoylalanine--D-glutamate ligase
MKNNLHIIVGLGASGLSCADYFRKKNLPYAMVDTRENPPLLAKFQQQYPDCPISLGPLRSEFFAQAAKIVLSPGVSLHQPVIREQIDKGVLVIGDIELFAQTVTKPVIAITGTNAKSTVTTLVGEMAKTANLKVQIGGNLGVPALELLAYEDTELFVLELSSFQLETTFSLRPLVATVLNITPDHLDRYNNLQHYCDTKLSIYQQCKIAVCNKDDKLTWYDESGSAERKIFFTLDKPLAGEFGISYKNDLAYLAFGDINLLGVKELPILGRHYQANALAALALGYAAGLPFDAMISTLTNFKGLAHRCQFVRELNGVSWYNDSKGTNVGATIAAIEGLGDVISGKIILIAGGLAKGADFSGLLPGINKFVSAVILIGEAASQIAATIGDATDSYFANDMSQAVNLAQQYAQAGDSVLLSPACASMDMFKDFNHRGEVFTQLVLELK